MTPEAVCSFSMESKDNTLKADSKGYDVVRATLLKINSASQLKNDLRNDFGFLRRIALIESKFGDETTRHQNGGIWQVKIFSNNLKVFLSRKINDQSLQCSKNCPLNQSTRFYDF